ncbi:MAG: exonuclease domain-containing protein [Sulfuricurvum sp.]|uniref:exonuclease domain-containing protein n=1 Tax=Sulfuricurvum sp. TaxID=2025608 RepID=UPI00262F920E|nr:exonuclease domain-containing protein [Sulfuricurvum sp.]MDD2369732.1 exonuclease domain-containing protein [Sulfuricurvum sp.]MDD2949550.1 exonuclease domain-containing protein [Sulfuricurvum sp.]MDD5118632.1 exonuclease domain-containing protein [Sulfuricurvum sp.]
MLVFLDTETTGVEVKDKICALGLITDSELHFERINPGKKIPPSASAIHHITNEMVKDAPSFIESISAQKLETLNISENVLVSHNAPFELSMLQKEGIAWQGQVIDTLKCAKSLMDDLEGYSLQFLRYELRLYREEEAVFKTLGVSITPHHALSDALHTRMVLEYLLDLADLERLIEISKSYVLLSRLPFGKYAKKRIEEIALKDPGYLKWMVESLMDMDEDLRYSIEYYLH